jgi:hypothetical protein
MLRFQGAVSCHTFGQSFAIWLEYNYHRYYSGTSQDKKNEEILKTNMAMTPEANSGTKWSWREGVIDGQTEHIELRYGDAGASDYEQWVPIALIGKPTNRAFPVRWLISPDNASYKQMVDAARKDLDFYLVEKHEANPWAYAKYHCNTAANMYSKVHWSYFPDGNRGARHASSVVRLFDGSKAIFKPAR